MQLTSFVWALSASVGLLTTPVAAGNIKGVFCHYLVQPISQDHANTNMRDAKAAGFDAMALDLFSATNEYSTGAVEYLFNAAASSGMKLFFSLDMTPNNLGSDSSQPSDFLGLVNKYASRDEYYKVDGRPFLSTFDGADKTFGQANSNDGWKHIFQQNNINPYWVPDFDQGKPYADNFFDQFPDVDGAFAWETAWPATYDSVMNVSSAQDQRTLEQAHAKGKVYMMPWSALQYKNLPQFGGLYQYRIGELNFAERISQIVALQPDYVELITWNDGGESHYIGSLWPEEFNSDQGHAIEKYTDGFDHTGWQQMLPAVIQAMKSGVQDVSKIFPTGSANIQGTIWYRSILTTSPCNGDKPYGYTKAKDAINYAFLLPEGSLGNYVKVFSNGQQLGGNIPAGAGLNMQSVPGLQPGSVRVEVWDVYGGSPIASIDGSMTVGNNGGDVCNYNYVVDALKSNR